MAAGPNNKGFAVDFGFTEEQLMIQDVARRIAQEKIAPSAEHSGTHTSPSVPPGIPSQGVEPTMQLWPLAEQTPFAALPAVKEEHLTLNFG